MDKKFILTMIIIVLTIRVTTAQTIYVDAQKGNDLNEGFREPFKSISKAVQVANQLTGQGSITIRIMPGFYMLTDKVAINPLRIPNDTTSYIVEAFIMPDDTAWTPEKMPVIQSISGNNSDTQFPHATGFLVASDNVIIRGLKFLGNPNPQVLYYYPVTRENPALTNMEVSQCYFIAEKNSAIIQGGVWAQGQNIDINHCVFKDCRNAILAFNNINGCSITYNLISGAYESAFWMGENTRDFEFSNNVITGCEFFWVNSHPDDQTYQLKNSVITGNKHYLGQWNMKEYGLVEIDHAFREEHVRKTGAVQFVKRTGPEIPLNYLHISPGSLGTDLNAGIFKTAKSGGTD